MNILILGLRKKTVSVSAHTGVYRINFNEMNYVLCAYSVRIMSLFLNSPTNTILRTLYCTNCTKINVKNKI